MYNENEKDWIQHTIVITNRKLVNGDYLTQIEKVAALSPRAIILREKDLPQEVYQDLAKQVKSICDKYQVELYVHTDLDTALAIGCPSIHLSVAKLPNLRINPQAITHISASCHSLTDVQLAIAHGATQIILGTIFETDCKKGLKGQGTGFVKQICDYCKANGNIPVYGIGGISPENLQSVLDAGAEGGCMMSYLMRYSE